jgi:hypothetical protein
MESTRFFFFRNVSDMCSVVDVMAQNVDDVVSRKTEERKDGVTVVSSGRMLSSQVM